MLTNGIKQRTESLKHQRYAHTQGMMGKFFFLKSPSLAETGFHMQLKISLEKWHDCSVNVIYMISVWWLFHASLRSNSCMTLCTVCAVFFFSGTDVTVHFCFSHLPAHRQEGYIECWQPLLFVLFCAFECVIPSIERKWQFCPEHCLCLPGVMATLKVLSGIDLSPD